MNFRHFRYLPGILLDSYETYCGTALKNNWNHENRRKKRFLRSADPYFSIENRLLSNGVLSDIAAAFDSQQLEKLVKEYSQTYWHILPSAADPTPPDKKESLGRSV